MKTPTARTLALAAVPLCFGCGNLAMRALLQFAPAHLQADLAQPLPVATAWGGYGSAAFAILASTILLAAVATVVAIRAATPAEKAADDSMRIGFAALASLALALAWPVAFSSDVYAYAAYGELALRGLDPYVRVAPNVHGALIDAARWQWGGSFPPCLYGTAFVAIARGLVVAYGSHGSAATLFAFRACAALAWLAAGYVFRLLASGLPARFRGPAVTAFALNPLALWCAAEGHNDALMMLLVLGGTLAATRGAVFAGGVAIGLSPFIKAAGAAAGPLLAIYLGATAGPRRALLLAGGYMGALALATAFVLPRLGPALAALRLHGVYVPQFSLQGLVGLRPALAASALLALAGVRLLATGRAGGSVCIAAALWLALPNPYPWYALWIVPVAAGFLGWGGWALWAATIAGGIRYLPDAYGEMGNANAMLLVLIALMPFAIAAAFRPGLRASEGALP